MVNDEVLPEKCPVNPFRINEIGLQLTNRCNMSCLHCGSVSGPNGIEGPSMQWCNTFAEQLAINNFSKLMITGGEPMLRLETLVLLVQTAASRGVSVELTTNGYWGNNQPRTEEIISRLVDAGLSVLTLSVDKIHQQVIPAQALMNITDSIRRFDFPFQLRIYGLRGKWGENDLAERIVAMCDGQCEAFTQPILPVGRAKDNASMLKVEGWKLLMEDDHPCHMVLYPFIDANLSWYLCSNGAILGENSQFCIGRLDDPKRLNEMVNRHFGSEIFRALRAIGPIALLECVGLPSGVGEIHVSVCDVCLHRLFSHDNALRLQPVITKTDFLNDLDEIETALHQTLTNGQNHDTKF